MGRVHKEKLWGYFFEQVFTAGRSKAFVALNIITDIF